MEPPAGGDTKTLQDAKVSLFRAVKPADPAHYVRGQYDGYRGDRRRRARLDDRDVRRAPARDRELALVGRAVLHPHRQAASGDPDRAPARLQAPAAARLRGVRPAARAEPAGDQARSLDGRAARRSTRVGRTPAAAAPIELDMEFADEGGEGATPYEVLLHAAMVGESTRFTRQDGVEETWRVMQPLLDAPPPVHVYAPGSWGPDEARRARRRTRPLARALDRVVSSRDSRRRPRRRRAPPRRRRSRRSRTTRSSPTATRARSSRPTARSTGCACRASTRRACSAACSTAGRASFGWRRSASTIRRPARTSPGRTSW